MRIWFLLVIVFWFSPLFVDGQKTDGFFNKCRRRIETVRDISAPLYLIDISASSTNCTMPAVYSNTSDVYVATSVDVPFLSLLPLKRSRQTNWNDGQEKEPRWCGHKKVNSRRKKLFSLFRKQFLDQGQISAARRTPRRAKIGRVRNCAKRFNGNTVYCLRERG